MTNEERTREIIERAYLDNKGSMHPLTDCIAAALDKAEKRGMEKAADNWMCQKCLAQFNHVFRAAIEEK